MSFGAPPLQAMAMPNVQISDDDDILMDYEDEIPAAAPLQTQTNGDTMMMDTGEYGVGAAVTAGEELMVPERVHIRGVDNLNTAQVKAYIAEHFDTPMVRLEWIDDTSLNAVYETPAVAISALAALSLPDTSEELPLLHLRTAKGFSESPSSRLLVRISKPSDRKERGARERSRYYLFHPEEDRADKFERERKDRRPRSRNSDTSKERGDYSRRHYDLKEDGARRRNNDYAEDMYDDGPKQQRSRSRSRSRSPRRRFSPRRYSRSRSPLPHRRRSPPELFPSRSRAGRRTVKELFPERSRSLSQKSKELFPEKTHGSKAVMDNFPTTQSPPVGMRELFPSRSTTATDLLSSSAQAADLFPMRSTAASFSHITPTTVELFPQKQKSLADRIHVPKSLAERISLPHSNAPVSSPSSTIGGGGSNDLFAQKMVNAKGEGLVSDNMIGGRRRGRKKADEFM